MELSYNYPHLTFQKHWELSPKIMFLLGKCEAFIKAISNTPILPEHYQKLLKIALIKGAQASTAIEGNTLTDEEIEKIFGGSKLPPSKEYQEIEVKNILEALNILREEVINQNKIEKITPELIKRFHKFIGKNLREHFDASPGKFRIDNRTVGNYRCPFWEDIPDLIDKLCEWLLNEFHFTENQTFHEIVIQAIVTHVYLEWIHPFGDGNGRTGRLLEFYILLRGGNPDITTHILSNHYNLTRSEYYRQLDEARKRNSLTSFLEYALEGFHEGLEQILLTIQESQFKIIWQKYVNDTLTEKSAGSKIVNMRRRVLLMEIPINESYSIEEIPLISPQIARYYAKLNSRTVYRDINALLDMNLMIKAENKYKANSEILKSYFPQKKEKL
jgi:Fic family protein